MLPRDTPNRLTQIRISAFENALEDALLDPRDMNRLYIIERAYEQKTLNLIDALEQTCVILMRANPMLLEAFVNIPRYDYQVDIEVDQSFDLWLFVLVLGRKPIRRRLGGGFTEDSGEPLLCLPQYAELAAELLNRKSENLEEADPSNQNNDQEVCSFEAYEVIISQENTSAIEVVSLYSPVLSDKDDLLAETMSEEDEVEELLQPTLMNTEVSFTGAGPPTAEEGRQTSNVPQNDMVVDANSTPNRDVNFWWKLLSILY